MIPLGLASSLLSDVGDAVSSGLSKLSGKTASSESGQASFAAHLQAATSQNGTSANHHAEGLHRHHMQGGIGALSASSNPSQAATGSSTTTSTAIGSLVNISA